MTVTAEATWGETIRDLAADLDRVIDQRETLATDIEDAFLEHPLGKVLRGAYPAYGAYKWEHWFLHEEPTTAWCSA